MTSEGHFNGGLAGDAVQGVGVVGDGDGLTVDHHGLHMIVGVGGDGEGEGLALGDSGGTGGRHGAALIGGHGDVAGLVVDVIGVAAQHRRRLHLIQGNRQHPIDIRAGQQGQAIVQAGGTLHNGGLPFGLAAHHRVRRHRHPARPGHQAQLYHTVGAGRDVLLGVILSVEENAQRHIRRRRYVVEQRNGHLASHVAHRILRINGKFMLQHGVVYGNFHAEGTILRNGDGLSRLTVHQNGDHGARLGQPLHRHSVGEVVSVRRGDCGECRRGICP